MLNERVDELQSVKPLQLPINDQLEPLLLLPNIYIVLGIRVVSISDLPLIFIDVNIMDEGI